ncbi:MAG: hypothetical protein Q4B62_02120 [Clostridiaceae bacterium]|nr:hypothetical protein [Clostridiaceae bacterium]
MKIKRIVAALTALSMLSLAACSGKEAENKEPETQKPEYVQQYYDTPAGEVLKTETVYVNLNSAGKVEKVNVTDWLHTDKGEVYVDDISSLENITNVKSEVLPVVDGEKLRWHMPETDLYYSGTTDKEPPVSIDISYSLNGKEVSADDIAGKSGDVAIKIKMSNNASKQVAVSGKKHSVYLPVLVVGGMILPEGVFSAVSVKNGQSLGDGSKEIVVFTGMPGFAESLDFKDKNLGDVGGLIVSDEVTVTAKTENFSLSNMYFAVLPIASLNLDIAMPETVDDLKNTLAALKSFQNALNKIDPDRIIYGLLSDKSKIESITGILDDALKLYNNNRNLISLISKYATPENAEAISTMLETLNDPDVKAALKLLSDPSVQALMSKLPGIVDGFNEISPVLEELQKDMERPEIQAETAKLPETIEALSEISKVISDNSDELNALTSIMNEDGTKVLESLLESIDADDLKRFEDKYGGLVDNGDILVELAEKWLSFGREYGLFTESTENMNTSLMFVYNTPAVEKAVSTPVETAVSDYVPWYKKIFS